MSVPNQKNIKISKEKCDKNHLYATINLNALQNAMLNLKGEAFKLWVFLSKNQDGYQFELSQKAAEEWGIKKDAYYAAVKKLIEKHFLVPIHANSNIHEFSEIQKTDEEMEAIYEKQKVFSEYTNPASEIKNNSSENKRRNITYNTEIIHHNTRPNYDTHELLMRGAKYDENGKLDLGF